jgi:hypothetical protein
MAPLVNRVFFIKFDEKFSKQLLRNERIFKFFFGLKILLNK